MFCDDKIAQYIGPARGYPYRSFSMFCFDNTLYILHKVYNLYNRHK